MKLFKATLVTVPNTCYVETVIVVAEDKNEAHQLLVDRNKHRGGGVNYTSELMELDIDISQKQVIRVGFGHGNSDNDWDD